MSALAVVTPATLPNATNGGQYAFQLLASGGIPPYVWTITNTPTEATCYCARNGWFFFSPTTTETFTVVFQVQDSTSATASKSCTVTVDNTLRILTDSTTGYLKLPPAIASNGYSAAITAFGGAPPYTATLASGALPSGLAFSGMTLTGLTFTSGNPTFSVKVTDSASNTAIAPVNMNISSSGTVTRPAYNSSSSNGFFVLNGQLYDPNGQPFIIRGINQLHFDSSAASYMQNTHCNAVRIWDGNATVTTYTNLITQYLSNNIFPIICMASVPTGISPTQGGTSNGTSGNTSTADLTSVVNWWVANVSGFTSYMSRIALNIANEWSGPSESGWQSAYETAVQSLRTAGWTCPIVIDASRSGQDLNTGASFFAGIQAVDPLKNCIFSYHAYGQTNNTYCAITNVATSGGNTVITLNNSAATHPFCPTFPGNNFTGQTAYFITGVNGLVGINGVQNAGSHNNVGGAQNAWTITLAGITFSGTYSGGGSIYSADVNNGYHYLYLMNQLVTMRAAGLCSILGEFGPSTPPLGTGSASGHIPIPSPTLMTQGELISAAEANGIGWINWAFDDNHGASNNSYFYDWSMTLGPPNGLFTIPSNLTASGMDVTYSPRYGTVSLGCAASIFLPRSFELTDQAGTLLEDQGTNILTG